MGRPRPRIQIGRPLATHGPCMGTLHETVIQSGTCMDFNLGRACISIWACMGLNLRNQTDEHHQTLKVLKFERFKR